MVNVYDWWRWLRVSGAVVVKKAIAENLHEFLFGAFWANNIVRVRDEAATNQRSFTGSANETVVVPVTIFERDEPSAADACNNTQNDTQITKNSWNWGTFWNTKKVAIEKLHEYRVSVLR